MGNENILLPANYYEISMLRLRLVLAVPRQLVTKGIYCTKREYLGKFCKLRYRYLLPHR